VQRIERKGDEKVVRFVCSKGTSEDAVVDEILVAVGRIPNVEGLNLAAVGVVSDRRGIQVNDRLQTTNPRIFAAGDVCMAWKFTHAADAAAKIVVQNALFFGRKKLSALTMPWCTYTDPEIAHVGMYERDASEKGIPLDTYTIPLHENDRAVADGQEEGFVRIHVRKGTDRIVGATIVAAHAGELISQLSLAMVGKLGLGTILNTIYPYPTQSEAIKRAAGVHARARLTPFVKKLFGRWMRLTR
jgi:pyruvate/2-oxoglutarate dehydrogenase complex dihydrolipoamide dehydrogenase (E3) component